MLVLTGPIFPIVLCAGGACVHGVRMCMGVRVCMWVPTGPAFPTALCAGGARPVCSKGSKRGISEELHGYIGFQAHADRSIGTNRHTHAHILAQGGHKPHQEWVCRGQNVVCACKEASTKRPWQMQPPIGVCPNQAAARTAQAWARQFPSFRQTACGKEVSRKSVHVNLKLFGVWSTGAQNRKMCHANAKTC
eukprot:scaffold152879_cov37-Tisochrysis_lutea.AAC.2